MNKAEVKKRIEKLRAVINRQRHLYHVLDKAEISDEAHDSLKHELWKLEQQFPDLVTPDSPTQRVGGTPLEKFKKVRHEVSMLSIEDVFGEKEVVDWEQYLRRLLQQERIKLQYFAELKIDGFAVSLLYRNGVFVRGATRGDGTVGEDVTQNLKTIESIPLKLSPSRQVKSFVGDIEVRGEVYMNKKEFLAFNKKREKAGEEPYANPRNLAAGSIRQLDPKLAASRPLRFMAYDVITDFGQKTHSSEHEILKEFGFKTDDTARVCKNVEDIIIYWREIEKKRDTLPFHIDGVVAQINENQIYTNLGRAGKSPRGIRALKFAGKQATTKVLDIQVQVGRTGAITPVALLEPVKVAGVMISRATLHNEDEIKRLGVKIGDTIIIERAGDVIPAVVNVIQKLRTGKEKAFQMPKKCPVCKTTLVRLAKEVVRRCPNANCEAQQREHLYHLVSRKAFDIDGLGPKIIDQLVDQRLVKNAADLFTLKEKDLISLERFADKSAENIVDSIQKSKKISLARFLYALGVRHVGEETTIDLANHFGSLRPLQIASKEDLEKIPDIGSVVAQSLYKWFRKKENIQLIQRLKKVGVVIQNPQQKMKKQTLKGKVFVLTGTLESQSRDEAKQKIRELGGEIAESVSSKTTYLVAGENPGTKLTKANQLHIEILNEQKFLRMLN